MNLRFYILVFAVLACLTAVQRALPANREPELLPVARFDDEPSDDNSALDERRGEFPADDPGPNGDDDPPVADEKRRMYDDEELPKKPDPIPDIEGLLSGIDEPAPAPRAAGLLPPPERWLDGNYQFLGEGDPFLPGTDPFREWPGVRTGWFAGIELTAARPSIHNEISSASLGPGDSVTGTFANTFQLPVANLEWFAMPKVYVGYRRENGLGEYLLSYRFIQSDGSGTISNFDAAGAGQFSSKLQGHVIDLEYGWTDLAGGLPWYLPEKVRRSMGLRFASAVFDTSASGAQILEEREGNVFLGAGPKFKYEGTWATPEPSLSFIGSFDIAGVIGFDYQRFGETALVGGNVLSAAGRTDGRTTATPILRVEAGLSWVPDWRQKTLRFSAGYQYEHWWLLTDTTPMIEITLQGPFVRAEWRW